MDDGGSDQLVLVDLLDHEIGSAPKLEVHERGLLHRAFSVVLWHEGSRGPEILMQRRAFRKYHSGGLWTNSCCSHPRTEEALDEAVLRRLAEELGIEASGLQGAPYEVGSFVYRAVFPNGVTEYEYDHVFVAKYAGVLAPDPEENAEIAWLDAASVMQDVMARPERYTARHPGVPALALGQIHMPSAS